MNRIYRYSPERPAKMINISKIRGLINVRRSLLYYHYPRLILAIGGLEIKGYMVLIDTYD